MKKKISRKIIVAGLAAVIGIGGLSGTVLAAGTYQPVSLNSYGVFSYDDGNANNNNGYKYDIFLDASDLTKLNDNLNVLKTDVDSCFQSVSSGKALLASTITGLGVSTASDATFNTINENIKTLATNKYNEGVNAGKASVTVTVGGTASNANILSGKTITVNGTEKYKGTMPDNGATGVSNLAAGASYTIPAGYTSGGTVTTKSLADQTVGTATQDDIGYGKTAWVNGKLITGIAGGSSSNGKMAGGSVYVGKTEDVIIDCGFRPSIIYVNASPDTNDYYVAWFYDELSSQKKKVNRVNGSDGVWERTSDDGSYRIHNITDTGFSLKFASDSMYTATVEWIALE